MVFILGPEIELSPEFGNDDIVEVKDFVKITKFYFTVGWSERSSSRWY